jgi:fluoroacetyl-CoA thioesterase
MTEFPAIAPGLSGTASVTVTEADTALSHRSGDVPVLATPRLVALCEEAACRALQDALHPSVTSVGSRVELDHIAPTAVGGSVTARAEVERTEGRTIVFVVSAEDSRGAVACGRVTRVLVDREGFLSKLAQARLEERG